MSKVQVPSLVGVKASKVARVASRWAIPVAADLS
jgi:hypothetical protein